MKNMRFCKLIQLILHLCIFPILYFSISLSLSLSLSLSPQPDNFWTISHSRSVKVKKVCYFWCKKRNKRMLRALKVCHRTREIDGEINSALMTWEREGEVGEKLRLCCYNDDDDLIQSDRDLCNNFNKDLHVEDAPRQMKIKCFLVCFFVLLSIHPPFLPFFHKYLPAIFILLETLPLSRHCSLITSD